MTASVKSRGLATVIRLVIGVILIYASHDKLIGSESFRNALDNYQILPAALLNLSAIVLPWVQFVTGICLVLGVLTPGAGLLAAALFAAFIGALVSALVRGLDIECGCFTLGAEAERVAWAGLWWRVLLLLGSLQVLLASLTLDWPAVLILKRRA